MNNLNDIFFAPVANQDLTYDQVPVSYTHLTLPTNRLV